MDHGIISNFRNLLSRPDGVVSILFADDVEDEVCMTLPVLSTSFPITVLREVIQKYERRITFWF